MAFFKAMILMFALASQSPAATTKPTLDVFPFKRTIGWEIVAYYYSNADKEKNRYLFLEVDHGTGALVSVNGKITQFKSVNGWRSKNLRQYKKGNLLVTIRRLKAVMLNSEQTTLVAEITLTRGKAVTFKTQVIGDITAGS